MIPKNLPLLDVSIEEQKWSHNLADKKKKEYLHSRGYIRAVLGPILNFDPLDLPLIAPPNKPPRINLSNNSYISLSHCEDSLFFGYSNVPFGLDIERTDRKIFTNQIIKRFTTDNEKKFLEKLVSSNHKEETLKLWVSKEAAIKFCKGKLFRDLKLWDCHSRNNHIVNIKNKFSLNLSVFKFRNWYISLVSDKKTNLKNIIICC